MSTRQLRSALRSLTLITRRPFRGDKSPSRRLPPLVSRPRPESASALAFTTGDWGTGNPYPGLSAAKGTYTNPYPLGATVACTGGGVAWLIALDPPVASGGAEDDTSEYSTWLLPVRVTFVGVNPVHPARTLRFGYRSMDGREYRARRTASHSMASSRVGLLYPNGSTEDLVPITLPRGADVIGGFFVDILDQDQRVYFSLEPITVAVDDHISYDHRTVAVDAVEIGQSQDSYTRLKVGRRARRIELRKRHILR